MSLFPDETWIALTTLTETNRPAEFPYVMQVILNRMRASQRSAYEIVRAFRQFSWFNDHEGLDERALYACLRDAKKLGRDTAPGRLEAVAKLTAHAMLQIPAEAGILPANAKLYWSPQSMKPRGALPSWDWSKVWAFTVPGVSPQRFVFASEVGASDPRAGNVKSLLVDSHAS